MSISIQHLSYIYSPGTPYEHKALDDVNLQIEEGKMTAIIGHTGSGKSTLVQHLNGLLLPSEGKIHIFDREIIAKQKPKNLKSLRGEVGLVFQFPEYQLFEETVLKDVSFGPKNFNVDEETAISRAKEALALVGIGEEYYERSPLELSGGQKRRVAIAGILAMNPRVLVLDEPTAGLDPSGTRKMMELFKTLNKEHAKTILLVTHDMEQVYGYCDDVIVIKQGKISTQAKVSEFFDEGNEIEEMNILPPALLRMKKMLREVGFKLDEEAKDIQSLAKEIAKQVKKHG
ncbi:MAG: energy-coupling factor transporter ATPase [Solobacterium sp.]|nr:energy-coupling factor transporter ATPase [Solobacterium sp.]